MNSDEKQHLLHSQPSGKQKKGVKKSFTVNTLKGVLMLCLVTYCFAQSAGIFDYIINEWTQFTIKREYFVNATISTSTSSCKNVNHSTDTYRNLTKVQQESAKWLMFNRVACYIPAFFISLALPPLTDTYGRKFLIVLSLFGIFVKFAAACIIIYTNQQFIYMVAAYAVEGITGASFTFFSVCFSFIADIVKDNARRIFCIVIVEFTLMISTMISGLLSGILIDAFGFISPAIACAGVLLFTLMVACVFLPESLRKENRTKPISLSESLMRPMMFYTSSAFKGKRLRYSLFLFAFGCAELVGLNRSSMETLYLLGMPFCFSPTWVGYFSFARHFGEAVIGLGSVKLMQAYMSNEAIAILSSVSDAVSYVVEALAKSEVMIFMGKRTQRSTLYARWVVSICLYFD